MIGKDNLAKAIIDHKRWLDSVDAEGTRLEIDEKDLSNLDLREAIFTCINFNSTNLENKDLSNSILCGSYLQDSNMQNAILSKANLDEANIAGSNLEGATAIKASFQKPTHHTVTYKAPA